MQPISAFRRRDLAPHRGKASYPSFVGGLIVPAEKNRVPLIVSKRYIVLNDTNNCDWRESARSTQQPQPKTIKKKPCRSRAFQHFLKRGLPCGTPRYQNGISSSKSIGGSLEGAGACCCGRDCAPPLNCAPPPCCCGCWGCPQPPCC